MNRLCFPFLLTPGLFSNGFRSIGNLPNLTPAFVVDVGIVSYNPGPVERERENVYNNG